MPDYSGLTNQELIDELNLRDADIVTLNNTITTKDGEIATLNTTVTEKQDQIDILTVDVSAKDAQITQLNTENAALQTVDGSIGVVSGLSFASKKELAHKLRTTKEGIKAYTAFLHGMETPA